MLDIEATTHRVLTLTSCRFYSSSGYFSVPPVVVGAWHDLSLANWELLEDELRERFDSVLSALQRTEPGTR